LPTYPKWLRISLVPSQKHCLISKLPRFIADLDNKAVEAAERRVTEIQKTVEVQRTAAEREVSSASSMVEELNSKLDELKAENERLSSKLRKASPAIKSQAM
jgi:colicin import membrane protein